MTIINIKTEGENNRCCKQEKKEHTRSCTFSLKASFIFLTSPLFFFFFSLPPSLIAFIPLLCLHPFFPGRGCGAAHHRFLFLYSDAMYRSPTFLCFCTRVCFYIFLYLFLPPPGEMLVYPTGRGACNYFYLYFFMF